MIRIMWKGIKTRLSINIKMRMLRIMRKSKELTIIIKMKIIIKLKMRIGLE